MTGDVPARRGSGGDAPASRTAAEWTTLAISVALIALLGVMVIWLYLAEGNEPAAIEVTPRLAELRAEESGYYLPVEITNRGGHTAEEVVVELTLALPAGEEETAELTVGFLAGAETARGTAVFTTDPRTGELTADVVSYLEP